MESEKCKGCTIFDNCSTKKYLDEINLVCPCSTCLVKGICNQDCKDFMLFKTKAEIKKVQIIKQRGK